MNIQSIRIENIKPYENNPRINDAAVPAVVESIREFGFKVPIILDRDNIIIAGHTRYKAALELGMEEIPCVIADDFTDEQIRAFRLVDNKVAEKSEWDILLLEDELKDINMNLDEMGFSEDELNRLFGSLHSSESYIDGLFSDTFARNDVSAEKNTFEVTFSFPNEHRETVESFIKANGKQPIVDIIIETVGRD